MFRTILFSLLSLACTTTPDDNEKAFADFVKRFNKHYASTHEHDLRLAVFTANYKFIATENAKGTNLYTLGVNHFSDLTLNEFAFTYFGYDRHTVGNATYLGVHEYQNEVLADSVDWRKQNAVTSVKNQGQCGSCWSFSTTGSLEGAWKIATNKLVSLSEEEFVQCDAGSGGCGGGSMMQAFQWAETQNACTESSYPYTSGGGTTGSCQLTSNSCTIGIPKGGVVGYKSVGATTNALMSAVSQQPVSIAVEADKSVFQSYSSGIMNGACGANLDHGILCIGYGTDNGKDYWLVKNSWGTVWGESGFGRLLRGKGGEGECGILAQTSYPVVSGSAVVV